MTIERILKQHEEILALIEELEDYLKKVNSSNSINNYIVSEILLKKSYLMGKLKVHLLTEEMYFDNLNFDNKKEYKAVIEKMLEISNKINEFDEVYKNISSIEQNINVFALQFKEILNHLKNRIVTENNTIYNKIYELKN